MNTLFSMTFGKMPTREQFVYCWWKTFENDDDPFFSFTNDKRLGTCKLTLDELWNELHYAYHVMIYTPTHQSGRM